MIVRRSNIISSVSGIRVLVLLLSIIFNIQYSIINSQVYPVHVTTQLAPPYSVYLADYAAPGCEQLRVVLLQRDLSQPAYQTFLRMSIEWNGREIMRTMPSYRPSPLTVSPGIPTIISGSDLYHYLDPQNMDFTGYSRETYLRTKALPEGQYRITFTAYDYARPEVAVSLPGSAFLYLAKTEPPLLNMPPNQYIQPVLPVQNVIFSWLSRNISSPNSANSTEYMLELFEIRPAGYNPNEIVNNTKPVFSTQVTQTQYVYNIADPALMVGMRYAWRVRAIDMQGRDAIRNNGYSEVFTFTYGETGDAPGSDGTGTGTVMPATAEGFKVETVAPKRARATWQPSAAADGYKLMYKETASLLGTGKEVSTEWKELETSKDYLELNGLAPGSTYEARLQSKLGTRWGGYSDLVSFTMPGLQEIKCGDPYTRPQLSREPLEELKPYAEIDAGGFPVTVLDATGSNGRFTGHGYAQVPMLGYVKLRVEFRNIFVNTDYYLVDGSIQVITDWENNAVWNADVITEGGKGTGKPDEGVEQADITVDFNIPNEESIHKDDQGNIVVDIDGKQVIIYPAPGTDDTSTPEATDNATPSPLGGDGGGFTVKDAGGNLYSVDTSTGQATYMGKASDNKPGATLSFDKKTVASDRAVAVFAQAPKSKYAFDIYNTKYAESLLFSEKYEELRTNGSEAYQVPFKLIPVGATDVVQVTITPAELKEGLEMKAINPDKIIFRTANGAEYKPKPLSDDKGRVTMELTLPAAKENDGYELYALHPVYAANTNGYEYDMLGKLTVVSYTMEKPKVVLVAVNSNTIDESAVKTYLDKVYLPVGVNWQVGKTVEFVYNIPKDSLDVTGSGLFSRYTSAMKCMNAAFMQRDDYDASTLYIFVLQRASLDNTSGDMPRGCQFGYIFTGAITDAARSGMSKNEIIGRTIAHELGHGMFKLKHTFDSEYRIAESTTDNLMDYNWGTDYVKHQWDAIHAPGLVIGLFERDEDAMMAVRACAAPRPERKGTLEAEHLTTEGLEYIGFGATIKCSKTWYYHLGSEDKKEGWYDYEDYLKIPYIKNIILDFAFACGDINLNSMVAYGEEDAINASKRLEELIQSKKLYDDFFNTIISKNESYSKFCTKYFTEHSGIGTITPIYIEFDIIFTLSGLSVSKLATLGAAKTFNVIRSIGNQTLAKFSRLGYKFKLVGPEYVLFTELNVEIARFGAKGLVLTNTIKNVQPTYVLVDEFLTVFEVAERSTFGKLILWKSPDNKLVWQIVDNSIDWSVFPKISMKNPLIDMDGWLMGRYINGELYVIGNTTISQRWDYIIKSNGEILVGRKHSWLSQGEDVIAAGELKFSNGKIVEINNASGHYLPKPNEAANFLKIFRQAGANVDDAVLVIIKEDGTILKQIFPNSSDRMLYY